MSTPDVRAGGEDPLDAAARELRERLEAKASEHEETRSREDFRAEVTRLDRLTQDFVSTLRAAWMMFTRYPHSDDWLLQRSTDDLLESAISIVMLAREGVFNVGRRELRYMLEATVKYVYVDQRLPGDASLAERVSMLGNTAIVPRSSITPIDDMALRLVDPTMFRAAVKSAFGAVSGYTHSSQRQLDERLRRAQRGEWTGFESARTLRGFNDLLFQVYDIVLALISGGSARPSPTTSSMSFGTTTNGASRRVASYSRSANASALERSPTMRCLAT